MQRPGPRETEIKNHRDDEDRRPEDGEKNDGHDGYRYPGNVRTMVESIVISGNVHVLSDLLLDSALNIVARTAGWGDGSRRRKSCPW